MSASDQWCCGSLTILDCLDAVFIKPLKLLLRVTQGSYLSSLLASYLWKTTTPSPFERMWFHQVNFLCVTVFCYNFTLCLSAVLPAKLARSFFKLVSESEKHGWVMNRCFKDFISLAHWSPHFRDILLLTSSIKIMRSVMNRPDTSSSLFSPSCSFVPALPLLELYLEILKNKWLILLPFPESFPLC